MLEVVREPEAISTLTESGKANRVEKTRPIRDSNKGHNVPRSLDLAMQSYLPLNCSRTIIDIDCITSLSIVLNFTPRGYRELYYSSTVLY